MSIQLISISMTTKRVLIKTTNYLKEFIKMEPLNFDDFGATNKSRNGGKQELATGLALKVSEKSKKKIERRERARAPQQNTSLF